MTKSVKTTKATFRKPDAGRGDRGGRGGRGGIKGTAKGSASA